MINVTDFDKYVLRTPLIPFYVVDDALRANIFLKPENLQVFGSYKIRGIVSVVTSSREAHLRKGLMAASAGNMAQAVAFVARQLQVPCRIFIPDTAPQVKQEMIKSLDAELISMPFAELWKLVRGDEMVTEDGVFIHPAFNDALLAGYAGIASEIMADLPDVDAVIIPFGVGGLSIGVGTAIKRAMPDIAVYTCEPETAAPLKQSLTLGRAAAVNRIPSFVDAIGTPEVLPRVYELLAPVVSDSLVVSLDAAMQAIQILLRRHKLLCEGAAGCSLAAAMQLARENKHRNIVCILSGGNIAMEPCMTP